MNVEDSLFERVTQQQRVPMPNPCRADDEEWWRFCRTVWGKFPVWGYDRAFVAELAVDFLPRVLAQMGIGRFIGCISPDARAIVSRGAPLSALPLDPDGRWMMMRLQPDSPDKLLLDSWSHAWRCPSLSRRGDDLIDLGAWLWNLSEAKAAFRIARLCGRKRPLP
jgi:hypothetical protein